MPRKRTYTGINYKLVACRCGARYACQAEWRAGQQVAQRYFAKNGDQIPGCMVCGRSHFVPVQQLHPGGILLSGQPCGCGELCREWYRVIG